MHNWIPTYGRHSRSLAFVINKFAFHSWPLEHVAIVLRTINVHFFALVFSVSILSIRIDCFFLPIQSCNLQLKTFNLIALNRTGSDCFYFLRLCLSPSPFFLSFSLSFSFVLIKSVCRANWFPFIIIICYSTHCWLYGFCFCSSSRLAHCGAY